MIPSYNYTAQIEPPSIVKTASTFKCAELISSRSVLVSWTPPANPQFDIDYYLVRVYRNGVFYTTSTSRNNSLDFEDDIIPFEEISADVSTVSTCGTISVPEESSSDESVNEGCPGLFECLKQWWEKNPQNVSHL